MNTILQSKMTLLVIICMFFNVACGEEEDSSSSEAVGGTNTAGTDTAGTNTAGTNTAGTDAATAGTDTAGTDTDTAGTDTAGTDTAGTSTAGTDTAGTDTAGTDTAGTDTAGTDTQPAGDEAGNIAGTESTGLCDYNGFTPVNESSTTTGFGIQYSAINSEDSPYDIMLVQIYSDFGGPTSPGSYSLDGINFADCGLCLLAYSGCRESGDCDKTFYADAGTVNITSLGTQGDTFAADLDNVVFKEVEIDAETFQSIPVAGGADWCIDDYSYSSDITDGSNVDCSSPDVTCINETVNNFSLQNCGTGEMVSLEDLSASKKALWFVLTAGWCPACREYIPEVIRQDDMLDSEGLEVLYVLGEDASYGQPTIEYCEQYAQRYTEDINRFYIDHDGEYSFATLFTNMWPYPDEGGSFGLPWNAIINPNTMEYVYADGAGGAGDINSVLNDLLNE